MLTNSIIAERRDIFQTVKTISFPEVFKAFHGGEMQRRGRFSVSLCPFHKENSPSFTIYDTGFKCYGCGEAGDSVAFVAKLLNLQPLEAAKAIADRFGIPVDDRPLSKEDRLRLARAKAEREQEKKLEQAFSSWCKETGTKARVLAEAIRGVLVEQGVDIDPELLPLVHELPRLEWWADTLLLGEEDEKLKLFRDNELRGWLSCRNLAHY